MIESLGYALATGAVGVLLLALGVWALDVATPGHLPTQISECMNAAVVTSARLLAVAAVAFTTIWVNADENLFVALGWTLVFGIVGIAMQTVATLLVGLLWRGTTHVIGQTGPLLPGAVLLASAQIAIAAVVVSSIA